MTTPADHDHQHDDPDRADRDGKLGLNRGDAAAGGARAHGFSRTANPGDEAAARDLAVLVARSLRGDKCEQIALLDVRGLSQVTDFLIVASGTSNVQMRAAARNAVELARTQGEEVLNHNVRENEPTWILVDLIDIVVHIFEPDTRAYYDLEMLWGDAERIAWSDRLEDMADDPARNRAGLAPGEAKSELQRSGEYEAFGGDDDEDDDDEIDDNDDDDADVNR